MPILACIRGGLGWVGEQYVAAMGFGELMRSINNVMALENEAVLLIRGCIEGGV